MGSRSNDPKEGKRLQTFNPSKNPLEDFLREDKKEYSQIAWQGKEFHIFIGCFTLQLDDLNLWRFSYGRDGRGFSIVSPLSAFSESSTQGIMRGPWSKQTVDSSRLTLYKVLYDDSNASYALTELATPLEKIQKCMDEIDNEIPGTKEKIRRIATMIVHELLYLYKDEAYKDEREVRAIEARALGSLDLQQHNDNNGFSKLYIETPSFLFQESDSKIIVGPKVEQALIVMIDLRHRLERQKWSSCEVLQSKVPYR